MSDQRTKIVTTIGPASRSVETMTELIEAGADFFRLNFSHGNREDHAENVSRAREAAERAGTEIGLLGDLPGPKLRIDTVRDGVVELETGSEVLLSTEYELGTPQRLSVGWEGLPAAVREGDEIYLADGRIRLRVREASGTDVRCEVETGGAVASHQGLNLPGTDTGLPSAGREDLEWIDFAVEQEMDLLAISFVRRAEDLAPVERRIRTAGSDIPVIAKIEKPQAAERAEEIVKAVTAGIMVARGDLGIELPIEPVPRVQKQLLRLAGRHARPSITATQMLASMVTSPRPTRAEVTDVANAIYDGTDARDALRGDRGRRSPGRGGPRDGPDRDAQTERDLRYGDWVFNRVATDADRRRRLGRPRRGRLDLHARAGGDRRADAQRADRAPRLGPSPAGAGARGVAEALDGAPDAAALRRQRGARRGLGEPAPAARRLRAPRTRVRRGRAPAI